MEHALEDMKAEDDLAQLVEKFSLVQGKKGKGKSLGAIHLAYNIRERFDIPIVLIGDKMGIKEAFGPVHHMSIMAFKEELEKLSVAAKEAEQAEQVVDIFKKHGISIVGAMLVIDESYELFDARRSSDKLVQTMGYFCAKQRHYHITLMVLAPAEKMLDQRITMQIDWRGRVYTNEYSGNCNLRFVNGLQAVAFRFNGNDTGGGIHAPYFQMYDSWNVQGYRKASLNIKNF